MIQFDKYISLKGNGLFRDQKIDVHLKIPINTKVIIDGNLDWRLRNFNLWECQPEDKGSNPLSEWIMTEDGLKCIDTALYNRRKEGNE